ncbi:MAG: AlpA family phage regulatory protein [Alphaproteobacteria bacterium]|nr:AlpA family phage regulatory protein [Alphaproteobacteria bacterium]
MQNSTKLPEEGFVRLPTILSMIPVGRSSWWAGVKTGRYPKPVRIGTRTTMWRVEDIRKLISSIEAENYK